MREERLQLESTKVELHLVQNGWGQARLSKPFDEQPAAIPLLTDHQRV